MNNFRSGNEEFNLKQELASLKIAIAQIQKRLGKFDNSSTYSFEKDIQILDGRDIQLGGTNGNKIGKSTSKIGFFGTAPVAQASAIGAPATQSGSYVQGDVQSIVTAVNSIRTALKNIGITA